MTSQHLILAAESWPKFSLEEQLGNIGSEVSRAIRAKGDAEYYWGAISRALDLFYLTIRDSRWKGRLKEIVRVKELFCAAALETAYDLFNLPCSSFFALLNFSNFADLFKSSSFSKI